MKQKAQWQHKTEFEINKRMKEVIKLTIEASEEELVRLRKKLERLQYGG